MPCRAVRAVLMQLMSNLDFPAAVKELGEAVSYLKGSGATKVGQSCGTGGSTGELSSVFVGCFMRTVSVSNPHTDGSAAALLL